MYLRVSTDRQTVANQAAEVSRLAEARGYEPVVYDEVESAAKARPVLDRMLSDARAGRIQAVAVWALDRLHRSIVGAIQTVLELDRLGVQVLSVRERTGWGDTQLKVHLRRLVELEYLAVRRQGQGGWEYELAYDGQGQGGERFLTGLLDVEELRRAGPESQRSGPGRPGVGGWSGWRTELFPEQRRRVARGRAPGQRERTSRARRSRRRSRRRCGPRRGGPLTWRARGSSRTWATRTIRRASCACAPGSRRRSGSRTTLRARSRPRAPGCDRSSSGATSERSPGPSG